MARKSRWGKAYEHTIIGMLTLAEFDVYQPVVDDQGIDGVIRIRGEGDETPRYHEFQVKGSQTWNGIRCSVGNMTRNGVLFLYCARHRELLWFLYEELADLFPAQHSEWGDIFLNAETVAGLKSDGRADLSRLLERLARPPAAVTAPASPS